MSLSIKLFVSCHKPGIRVPSNPLLVPIQVGTQLAQKRLPMMLHDDEGDGISEKNSSYCELTGQYWAWKNAVADYYGFLHYRRYFNFSDTEYPIHHEPFIFGEVVFDRNDEESLRKIAFDEKSMREIIESHDFIAPVPIATPDGVSVYEQYRLSSGHHIEDLDTVLSIIEDAYPEIWPSALKYMSQTALYACNMFVMKRNLFKQYSNFLFDVLGRHELLCDTSHYTAVGRRVSGYLGERLCGIYLTYLYDCGYHGCDLQRVYFRDTDIGQKADTTPVPSQASQREIRFGMVTRGNEKIYSAISLPLEFHGKKAVAYAETEAGIHVPAKVVITHDDSVLVLSILGVVQVATVRILDEDGTVLVSARRRFPPVRTRVMSQGNTLVRSGAVNQIRNCDEHALPGDVKVTITQIIPDDSQTDIIHGTIIIPLADITQSNDLSEIVAIGSDGNTISRGDWICLDDELIESPSCRDSYCRRLSYSLRVAKVPSFSVWAHFSGSEHQDGFTCMGWSHARNLRGTWKAITTPACDSKYYEKWYLEKHRASEATLSIQRRWHSDSAPLFSIVVPLYKTPLSFFKDMVASVTSQTYARWELILVNASSDDTGLTGAVSDYCASDQRIKNVSLDGNRGITENTNEGIKVASGDFVCFLDHDDVLEPDALYCYASAIETNPDIDLLYCDEDKLANGHFVNPFFKPDWNPDLLLGMNYVCHFLTVRRDIVDVLDPAGSEYDGSQDYHMTFRVGEKARSVCHIPRVLYHWRVHEHSTAMSASQKDYTLETSRRAVQTHLDRCCIPGKVVDSPLSPRRFVVEYDLSEKPFVSIVIPNKDSIPVLNRCLVSIRRRSTYQNYEIVIVENNSMDEKTFDYYESVQSADSRIRVVTLTGMQSFNFSRIINYGVSQAKGSYILMLNNDTEVVSPDWIEQLLGPCTRKDVGATGAKLFFPDGTIQHAGVTFGLDGPCHISYLRPRRDGGNFESTLLARDVSAVTGACLLVRRDVFDKVGGMDEDLAVNYNDIDFCLKILGNNLHVVFCPTAELLHFESVSRGSESEGMKALRFRTEKGLFMKKWPRVFEEGDPCGNPNFELGNIYEVLNQNPRREAWD